MHGGFTSSGKCRRIYETQTGIPAPTSKTAVHTFPKEFPIKNKRFRTFLFCEDFEERHDEWPTSTCSQVVWYCVFAFFVEPCVAVVASMTRSRGSFGVSCACLIVKFFVGKINSCLSCVSESCLVIPPAQLVNPPMTTHSSRIHIFLQYMIYVFFFSNASLRYASFSKWSNIPSSSSFIQQTMAHIVQTIPKLARKPPILGMASSRSRCDKRWETLSWECYLVAVGIGQKSRSIRMVRGCQTCSLNAGAFCWSFSLKGWSNRHFKVGSRWKTGVAVAENSEIDSQLRIARRQYHLLTDIVFEPSCCPPIRGLRFSSMLFICLQAGYRCEFWPCPPW